MSTPQYPALHQAADAASQTAQTSHLRLTKATLGLLILTAAVAAWTPADTASQRRVAYATAAVMFAALVASIIHRSRRFDDQWFKCRAIAENVKSAAWYFAMQSPQPSERTQREDEFLAEIAKVRDRFPEQAARLARHLSGAPEITAWMRATQLLPFKEKIAIFRKDRIQNQVDWYVSKARTSAGRESNWSAALILLECSAVGGAVLQTWMLWPYSVPGLTATVASAALTWTQTKRFSDLANSYAVAAQDLQLLLERADRCRDSKTFLAFVADVEMAISREHSIWLGRRVG